jgi:cysteine desulfurase
MDTRNAGRCYFDWAASAVPDFSYRDFSELSAIYGNPSSRHLEGRKAREALDNTRTRCADVLGVNPKHIYFTSGGTEANALVLHSLLRRKENGAILATAVEHPSVRENCLVLEQLGKKLAFIETEKDGRVTNITLEKALDKNPDTRFVAIMAVNNEVGAKTDMRSLIRVIREKKGAPIHIHSDIVQAVGKIPLEYMTELDSASLSAHKIGGTRGIGRLYLKKEVRPFPPRPPPENGIRAGTENVAGAILLAECLERKAKSDVVYDEYQKASARFKALIAFLRSNERALLIPHDRKEEDERFSPYILQVAFRGIPGEVMVRALDDAGFAVSTGSACSSDSQERPVLVAMGIDAKTRLEGIRISQGYSTTHEEIELLIKAVKDITEKL